MYLGVLLGNLFSTVNPFSVILACYSAGINFADQIVFRVINLVLGDVLTVLYFYWYYRKIKKNEKNSVIYDLKEMLEEKYLISEPKKKENENLDNEEENQVLFPTDKNFPKNGEGEEFTIIQKIALVIFILGFITMITGIIVLNWWFEELSCVVLIISIIFMFMARKGEENSIQIFIKGAGEFIGVTLILGLARGINITLEQGKVSDTILNIISNGINGFPKVVFAILMLLIFIFLGFFIQSCTALAVLAMPIFAPLADEVDCSRNLVINAFMYGQGLIGLIAPTGVIMVILQVVNIPYKSWIKYIWKYMLLLFILILILIIIDSFL